VSVRGLVSKPSRYTLVDEVHSPVGDQVNGESTLGAWHYYGATWP
jgi:hypothetical protein